MEVVLDLKKHCKSLVDSQKIKLMKNNHILKINERVKPTPVNSKISEKVFLWFCSLRIDSF